MRVPVRSHRRYQSGHRSRILFLLPSLTGVLIFVLIPFGDVVRRSFVSMGDGHFTGMKNFTAVFSNQAFLLAAGNTLRFVAVGLPLLIGISLVISLLLVKSPMIQGIKSMFLFPMAVPAAAVVLIWKLLFYRNGIFNTILTVLGGTAVDWLGSDASFVVLVLSYLWKNTGYTIVLWLAGLKNIPVSLLEAAQIDGAGKWNSFRYVVFPELMPVLYTVVILSFLNSFKVYREAYLVAGAYPQEKMYLLQHLFNNWFTNLSIDKMAAAAVIIALMAAAAVSLLQKIWDRTE